MEGSGQAARVEGRSVTPHRRGGGRPSTVAQYAPQVAKWLREDPALSGAEILRRFGRDGYRGGKSALYELVRRLRVLARPESADPKPGVDLSVPGRELTRPRTTREVDRL